MCELAGRLGPMSSFHQFSKKQSFQQSALIGKVPYIQ